MLKNIENSCPLDSKEVNFDDNIFVDVPSIEKEPGLSNVKHNLNDGISEDPLTIPDGTVLFHEGKLFYNCSMCDYITPYKSELMDHFKLFHNFRCSICNKSFKQSLQLQNHYESAHEVNELDLKYKCPICRS